MKASKLLASLVIGLGLVGSAMAQIQSMADQDASLYRKNAETVIVSKRDAIRMGVPESVDAQVRDFILNKFGVSDVEQYGDHTQRTIYSVMYLGKNRLGRKYNDFTYYTYYISSSAVRRGARGEYRGSTSLFSIELDVIMKQNGTEINEYKWTTKTR